MEIVVLVKVIRMLVLLLLQVLGLMLVPMDRLGVHGINLGSMGSTD